MDQTLPRTLTIDGKTFVVAAGTALEVLGGAAAAPEVAAALAGGVAVGAIAAALPVKQVTREEAMQLGADERARFGGSAAAMQAAGVLESPFQNRVFVDSLPTQAQLNAIVPHPSAMAAPSLPTDHVTTYPGLAPPINVLHLPTPPVAAPHVGLDESQAVPYVDSRSLIAGRDALARLDKCEPGFESFKSFSSLQRSIDSPPGWQDHHIVEQGRGTQRFGTEVIQNTSNVIPLPPAVHKLISSQYSAEFEDAAGQHHSHYRDYMKNQPFERQRTLGIKAVGDAITEAEHRKSISPELADKLHNDLRNIDRPELCASSTTKINPAELLPTIDDLNKAHRRTQSAKRPTVAERPERRAMGRHDAERDVRRHRERPRRSAPGSR